MDRTLVGSLVILVGVILLLENVGPEVGIRDIGIARLWPLVLVAYGLATMLRGRRSGSDALVGLLITVVGAAFLAETLFGIELWIRLGSVIRNYWPIALIVLGGYLVLQDRNRS